MLQWDASGRRRIRIQPKKYWLPRSRRRKDSEWNLRDSAKSTSATEVGDHGGFSIEDPALTVAWNQGPGTPQQEADFTIPSVVSAPTECSGDINGDGEVNGPDLAFVLGDWGACSAP